jgi:hypothetical protein
MLRLRSSLHSRSGAFRRPASCWRVATRLASRPPPRKSRGTRRAGEIGSGCRAPQNQDRTAHVHTCLWRGVSVRRAEAKAGFKARQMGRVQLPINRLVGSRSLCFARSGCSRPPRVVLFTTNSSPFSFRSELQNTLVAHGIDWKSGQKRYLKIMGGSRDVRHSRTATDRAKSGS